MEDPATTIVFTDPVLTAGVTSIKPAHLNELRQAVAAMRTAAGLPGASWTDDPISAGALIRATHVTELRIALQEAREALGLDPLSFTDGTLTPEVTVVKNAHIQELRDGVQ